MDQAARYVRFGVQRPHAFSAYIHAKPPTDDPRVADPTAGLEEAVKALLLGFRHLGVVPSPLPQYRKRDM